MPMTHAELLAQNAVIKELTTYAVDGWVQVRRELCAVEARVDIVHDGQRHTITTLGQSVSSALDNLLAEVERLQELADEEWETYREAQVDRLCGSRP